MNYAKHEENVIIFKLFNFTKMEGEIEGKWNKNKNNNKKHSLTQCNGCIWKKLKEIVIIIFNNVKMYININFASKKQKKN